MGWILRLIAVEVLPWVLKWCLRLLMVWLLKKLLDRLEARSSKGRPRPAHKNHVPKLARTRNSAKRLSSSVIRRISAIR